MDCFSARLQFSRFIQFFLTLFFVSILVVSVGCGGGGSSDSVPDINDGLDDAVDEGGDDPVVEPVLTITASNPKDGETNTPVDQLIAISFSMEVDPASIDNASVVVTSEGSALPVQITANKLNLLLALPVMATDTLYTVTVKNSIVSVDGYSLEADQVFSFTTGQTFTDGSIPREEDLKPLGPERFITLVEKNEFMLLGRESSENVRLIDPLEFNSEDPLVGPNSEVLYTDTNADLVSGNTKRVAIGSIDNDFFDELVVVSWSATEEGVLTIYDHAADTSEKNARVLDVDLSIDSRPGGAYQYDIAMGDVDSDGLDELLLVGVIDGSSAATRLGKIWIFDDHLASHALLHSVDLKGQFDSVEGYVGLDRVAIASGNIDDDAASELVVAYYLNSHANASLVVLDDQAQQYAEIKHGVIEQSNGIVSGIAEGIPRYIRVDTGDTDQDGRDEILVGWIRTYGPSDSISQSEYWLFDDGAAAFSFIYENGWGSSSTVGPLIPEAKLVDLDGDRMAEIFVMGNMWNYDLEFGYNHINDMLHPCGDPGFLGGISIAVGDVNGDMREDLIIYNGDGNIEVTACAETPHYSSVTGELESTSNEFRWISVDAGGSPSETAIVAAVNVDQDSLVVRYGGDVVDPSYPGGEPGDPVPTVRLERTVYFADNRLIAVVAAPPCAEGIGQNVDGCSAGFGTTIGGSLSSGISVAVRNGVLVGVEEEIQGGFVFASVTLQKFEVEVSAEVELAAHIESTIGISTTITDYTVHGEDIVVFSTTPYDRYIYEVVSHSEESAYGKIMTVDVPQRPRVLTVTREYYNATNGDQMDIGPSILSHVPGQLDTYPSRTEISSYLSFPSISLGNVGPYQVNQGSASKEAELEIATELTAGVDLTLNVDSTVKVCAAAICGGVTRGFSLGTSFAATLSTATTFISEVGAIDAENYPLHKYTYGMFAYTKLLYDPEGKTMQNFVVVNHWVD